ncbi:protein FAM47E isoform X2 [Anguilla rostrata]|uniref:protein FAM47E isoform X2 n=1 Tax=Anguilla rostrata TaxID=7938 RepID=UPI0030D2AFC3
MADIKFLPRIVPAGKSPLHPWYKERLRIKCQKATNKQCLRGGLDARGWRFLKPGLDDFRNGYPPPIGDQNFIRIQRGFSPVCGTETKTRKHLTKEQVCFSKENPQQQARRHHVAEVEYTLTQHPLALYPHLQECMPPELLDQVVSVLDPEMGTNSEAASFLMDGSRDHADESTDEHAEQNKERTQESSRAINTVPPSKIRADDSRVKNPYIHLRVKENGSKDDQGINGERSESPSLDEEIRRVTKQLHDWVVSLDREKDDLTESTMFNLLASAFEMKPPSQIQKSTVAKPSPFLKAPGSLQTHAGEAEEEYGALSQRNRARTLLDFPTGIKEQERSATQRNLDEELEQSYTAQAFKKFIANKGLREPEFLSACEQRRGRSQLPEH